MNGETSDIRTTDDRVGRAPTRVRVRDYHPRQREDMSTRPLLWIHGGAFMFGGLDQRESDLPARRIAAGGRWVRTVEYRLLPAAPPTEPVDMSPHPNQAPAALDDVEAAYLDLVRRAANPAHVGGASAGAALAAGLILRRLRAGSDVPLSALLIYGTFHARLPHDDEVEARVDTTATALAPHHLVETMNRNYTRDDAALRPGEIFPGGARLEGFPPALLHDAERDGLRASGRRFAHELSRAGVATSYEVALGARHGFLDTADDSAVGTTLATMDAWLMAHDRPS